MGWATAELGLSGLGRIGPSLRGSTGVRSQPIPCQQILAASASVEPNTSPSSSAQRRRRGVVILPGLGNNAADYNAISADLRARGLAVATAQVSRPDWLRNAAGLTTWDYWRGTLQPLPTVDWYMQRISAALADVEQEVGSGPVTLLAHSAGGWLSRVFLLEAGVGAVDRLVTLGSPHNPPPMGVADQTRGILNHVSATTPGNFHEQIAYVSVAGKWVKGARLREKGATWGQKVAGAGYAQVCGDASVWGDGITPVDCAHLTGAKQITLEGVYHSPLGAVLPAADGSSVGRPWYGSPSIVSRWVAEVARDASELTGFEMEIGDVALDSMVANTSTK